MNRLLITADLGRLKIYRVKQDELFDTKPSIKLEQEFDPPDLHSRFAERDTDEAGRFPRGTPSKTAGGMSYGERHNEEREAEEHQLHLVAGTINAAVEAEGGQGFYLAAPQTVHKRLLDLLTPEARNCLLEHLAVDLNKAPKLELLRRFGLHGE